MKEYQLSPEALVMTTGSSVGTQRKYYDNGFWYKQNQLGYEGYVEYLASNVLKCSNVKDFVVYEECRINGRNGCRSENFLGVDEAFISFQRLYEMYYGLELNDSIRTIPETKDRITYTLDFIREVTGVDCSRYISQILSLDMLILNTDRHMHNLGLIVNRKEKAYRPAPIFDNGNSLLSDFDRFDSESLEENIDSVVGQPFSASLEMQAEAAGIGLQLDYKKLQDFLEKEPDVRAVKVLKYQLKRYSHIIPDKNTVSQ